MLSALTRDHGQTRPDLACMNIPAPLKNILPSAALLGLLCGCASVGPDFNYQNAPSLELGQTRIEDYQKMFGKPNSIEEKETADGRFELMHYVHAYAELGTARARALNLEFRDGVLNSYDYLSSFDKDKTTLN